MSVEERNGWGRGGSTGSAHSACTGVGSSSKNFGHLFFVLCHSFCSSYELAAVLMQFLYYCYLRY